MGSTARRQQPAITIRLERAVALLCRLVVPGRSQAAVIEQALEQMAASRQSLAVLLMPKKPLDFDWEPPRSGLAHRDAGLAD
jgi:hypothetical protein